MAQLIAAIGVLLAAFFGNPAAQAIKDSITATLVEWTESLNFRQFVTDKVNAKLASVNLDVFRDILDKDKTIEDLDRALSLRINTKAGTHFTTLKNITRDDFLAEVSKVLADRVNAETGANIQAMWPVQRLRDELGTELLRQFDDSVDLPAGALFPRERVLQIKGKLTRGLAGYRPAEDLKTDVKNAQNRARQAKYRRTHRQIWIEN